MIDHGNILSSFVFVVGPFRANKMLLPQSIRHLRLGWLLAELGFVLGGELGCELRVANEALRLGTAVFFAPVALLLKVGG